MDRERNESKNKEKLLELLAKIHIFCTPIQSYSIFNSSSPDMVELRSIISKKKDLISKRDNYIWNTNVSEIESI